MDEPPGFIGSVLIPGGKGPTRWLERQELTCAGTWGCHGDRTIEDPYEAIYGAHHEDDGELDGSTVGKSYRFLYGIKGAEDDDWEYQATPSRHNGYKGDPDHKTMDTISYLCGECHAQFHPSIFLGGTETGSLDAWHRHPTDVAFGSIHRVFVGSEYQSYMIYSLEAPVAFEEPTGQESDVNAESIIMCMSCHRAHASPNQDSLRWDYTEMVAGETRSGNNGCFACHTRK
jgi:predicted CXXCH cytochrome family protein